MENVNSQITISESDEFETVRILYDDYVEDLNSLNKLLVDNPDLLSVLTRFKDRTNKVFIVAVANSFEKHLTRILPYLFSYHTENIIYFFTVKFTLSRKYHTLFSWDKNNANSFYGLWGEEFSNEFKKKIAVDELLKDGERNFLSIGNLRNKIAHEGFDSNLETGWEDIENNYKKFKSALSFYSELISNLQNKVTSKKD